MISFDFNTNIIEQVINELTEAKSFIKIAIFQIHHQEIFNTLLQKLNGGVSVEIFTLPYDSINDEIKEIVTERFERLNTAGAVLNFCKWNVGDPERTTTAVGRWYSYHGKFLVTDRCAISLSANFTESQELDAILLYKDEQEKINDYL